MSGSVRFLDCAVEVDAMLEQAALRWKNGFATVPVLGSNTTEETCGESRNRYSRTRLFGRICG